MDPCLCPVIIAYYNMFFWSTHSSIFLVCFILYLMSSNLQYIPPYFFSFCLCPSPILLRKQKQSNETFAHMYIKVFETIKSTTFPPIAIKNSLDSYLRQILSLVYCIPLFLLLLKSSSESLS